MLPTTLAIDLGSTHFKAALYRGTRAVSSTHQTAVSTRVVVNRVELLPHAIDRAFEAVLKPLRSKLHTVDRVILSNQGPSVCVADSNGKLLFPVITHLDRRSSDESNELVQEFGANYLLSKTGNLPVPGGIASTTLRWIRNNYPAVLKKAAFVGSLNNLFTYRLTGTTAMDPGNAAYLGLLQIEKQKWHEDLAQFVGLDLTQLPEIESSDALVGFVSVDTCKRYNLKRNPAVFVGSMDSSACVAGVPYRLGDLFHLSGTTDVLMTVTGSPNPSPNYLTRPLGFSNRWLAIRAVSAGGATLRWGENLLGVHPLSANSAKSSTRFSPYLAGDRLSINPRTGSFEGLTLGTTREQMAAAIRDALGAEATNALDEITSALRNAGNRLSGRVWCSGGNLEFARFAHRLWKKNFKRSWRFQRNAELGMFGLARLAHQATEGGEL